MMPVTTPVHRPTMPHLNARLNNAEERASLAARYLQATPFQHVVIDDVFPEAMLDAVVDDFSRVRHNTVYNDKTTLRKHTCDEWGRFPPATFDMISYLNCGEFVSFLSEVTGIQGLTSDPYLMGGGLHETMPGGFLKMHVDFNYHRRLELDRRINAIIFLNRQWEPSWGGELVLADPGMNTQVPVAPIFNRMVLFNTNDFSYHGQPDPHTFPEGNSRKSIAMYYYSNGRPAHETTSAKVGTTYKARHSGDLPMLERLKEAARLLAGTKRAR